MAVLAVLLSALVFAPVSYAADADSSVSDTLVSQASSGSQNVSAAGNVFDLNGDDDFVHFSAVEGIIINGNTEGDIIGFSYSPVINASVGGSVRYAANIIEIKGDVARNITVLAMEMTSSGSSKGVYFAGGTLYFSGSTGTLSAQAEKVYLSGQVDGDINIEADSVEFLNGFSCTGKITLTAFLRYPRQYNTCVYHHVCFPPFACQSIRDFQCRQVQDNFHGVCGGGMHTFYSRSSPSYLCGHNSFACYRGDIRAFVLSERCGCFRNNRRGIHAR